MTPEEHLSAFLQSLGFQNDPECKDTAQRVTQMFQSWSLDQAVPTVDVCDYRGTSPILLRDFRMYSLCAHHLLPFLGTADIVHRPEGRIAGFGSFAKILRHFSQRPQIQERLGDQVAASLQEALGGAILVRLRARHMCMEMRGAENGALVETLAARGPHAMDLLGLLR